MFYACSSSLDIGHIHYDNMLLGFWNSASLETQSRENYIDLPLLPSFKPESTTHIHQLHYELNRFGPSILVEYYDVCEIIIPF